MIDYFFEWGNEFIGFNVLSAVNKSFYHGQTSDYELCRHATMLEF